MKFLKLEILNLASLDRPEGETVDFEHGVLGNSTIFSIVGTTGSGKSTLLDAICLPLYGRAPRYTMKKGERGQGIKIYGTADEGENNRLAPTDPRNILTRGKKKGFSKLTFLANNGTVYRAEWSIQFKKKRYTNAETSLSKLISENGSIREEVADWNDLPSIIGLDFDQFLCTVLIAQGSFANFIKADENDRYELLEKLIGCETLYTTIASKIKEKKNEAETAYIQQNAECSALDKDIIHDEKRLKEIEARIEELEQEERNAKAESIRVSESLAWFTQEATYASNIKQFEEALKEARQKVEEIKDSVERLTIHDATLPAMDLHKGILETRENIQNQEKELNSLSTKIKGKKEKIRTETITLTQLEEDLDQAAKKQEEQMPHINKARTLKGELEASRKGLEEKKTAENNAKTAWELADKAVRTNGTDIENGKNKLEIAKEKYESLKSTIDETKKKNAEKEKQSKDNFETEAKKAEGLDAQILQEASDLALQKKNDIGNAIVWFTSIKTKTKELKDNQDEISRLSRRNNEISERLAKLKPEELRKELELHRKTRTLMTSENWEEHRHILEDGKPCPLCGSTCHPFQVDEELTPVLNELDELISKKETLLQEATEISEEKGRNEAKMMAKKPSVKSLESELALSKIHWAGIQAKYPDWPEDVDGLKSLAPLVELEARKAGQNLTGYNSLVKRIDALRIEKERAEKASQQYKEASDNELEQAKTVMTDADKALQTEKGKTPNLKQQAEEKMEAFRSAEETRKKAEKEIKDRIEEIRNEIGDNDPDIYAESLEKAKKTVSLKLEAQKKTIADLEKEEEGFEGQVKATSTSKSENEHRLEESQRNLKTWIDRYNSMPEHQQKLTDEDIASIYEMTDDWDYIRSEKETRSTDETSARTTYENECKAHKEHQKMKPEQTEEQLRIRKDELDGRSNAELVYLQTLKNSHDIAQKAMDKTERKKKEAEVLLNEWKEIADSIGSEGKTLRKIAQCYTLRFLIEHANAEIGKFNTRYELQQVKNSLGIRVIDHDRADDVRDTTSLSGGETFIVSLGLALGLASLSSRNISFGNLFIDEGFGTLDADTLAIVLNALAMLQSSQGKKVGVISHTDTMSDCITTQIQVIKDGNSGSSHLEFYPKQE